jgi:hypothetical protein
MLGLGPMFNLPSNEKRPASHQSSNLVADARFFPNLVVVARYSFVSYRISEKPFASEQISDRKAVIPRHPPFEIRR